MRVRDDRALLRLVGGDELLAQARTFTRSDPMPARILVVDTSPEMRALITYISGARGTR